MLVPSFIYLRFPCENEVSQNRILSVVACFLLAACHCGHDGASAVINCLLDMKRAFRKAHGRFCALGQVEEFSPPFLLLTGVKGYVHHNKIL